MRKIEMKQKLIKLFELAVKKKSKEIYAQAREIQKSLELLSKKEVLHYKNLVYLALTGALKEKAETVEKRLEKAFDKFPCIEFIEFRTEGEGAASLYLESWNLPDPQDYEDSNGVVSGEFDRLFSRASSKETRRVQKELGVVAKSLQQQGIGLEFDVEAEDEVDEMIGLNVDLVIKHSTDHLTWL